MSVILSPELAKRLGIDQNDINAAPCIDCRCRLTEKGLGGLPFESKTFPLYSLVTLPTTPKGSLTVENNSPESKLVSCDNGSRKDYLYTICARIRTTP